MQKIQFSTILFLSLAFISTAQERFSDCEGAIILCSKSDIIVKKLYGIGQELSEVGFASCSERLKEKNTVWLKWQIDNPGLIEFTIEPLENGDDIDFIVYRLDDDIRRCSKKYEIRCMASGEHVGAPADESFPCLGKMGLTHNASDLREKDGCGGDQDNYLAAIDAKKGENYILYVNNYTSDNGFKLKWGGNASFIKPKEFEMPNVIQTQTSKAIYFNNRDDAASSRTGWLESTLNKAFLATLDNSRSSNVFAGCSPGIENIEQIIREQAVAVGTLFPNPATASTNVVVNSPISVVTIVEIYDILGRLCFAHEYIVDQGGELLQFPTDQMRSGFYLVNIRVGKTVVTKKLMIANN